MLPLIFLILIVAAFGVLAAYAPRNYATAKRLAIIFSGIVLVLSIVLVYYGLEVHGFLNSIESVSYISQFGIDLAFTAAPVQIILILLAAIVSLCATIVKSSKFENSKNLYPLIMLFELSAIGLFASGNLFIFYIFWDVGVIAAYFMISSFGQGQAKHAANAYLVYSIFASALLLFSIMMIYFYTPVHSFSISYITAHSYMIPQGIQAMIFALFFIAFMVKMPIFPFHSWISNAYASAPTQGSMVIAGVLSKFGAYGMLLLFSMLSVSSDFSKYAFAIGGISAFYAAFVAMRQADLKKIAAYTSMVEAGIILIGIASLNSFGTDGAIYLMLAHGLVIALTFAIIGGIEIAFGERNISVLKGVVKDAMGSAYSFLIAVFASTGIPLTAGFIADVLVFIGAIKSFGIYGIIPLFSIMVVGFYLYWVVNRSFLSTKETSQSISKVPFEATAAYVLLAASIFLFGVFPSILMGLFNV